MKNCLGVWWVTTASLSCCIINSNAEDAQKFRGGDGPPYLKVRRIEGRNWEQFGITNDVECKSIDDKIQKLNEMRRAVGIGCVRMNGFSHRGSDDIGPEPAAGDDPRGKGKALGQVILTKALGENEAKLAKIRKVRDANEAKLGAALEELPLSIRQEVAAVRRCSLK